MFRNDRLEQTLRSEANVVENMVKNLRAVIHPMGGATIESIDEAVRAGHAALDRSGDYAKIILRERG